MITLTDSTSPPIILWSLTNRGDALTTLPYHSRECAEKILHQFKKAYPGVSFSILNCSSVENGRRIVNPVIGIKRYDITLSLYRNYPDLAYQVDAQWGDRFVKPDPKVEIIDDIAAYNLRKKHYSIDAFVSKLQRRFDEAQLMLGQERFGKWDDVVNENDCSNDWEEFDIPTDEFTGCMAAGPLGKNVRNMEVGTATTSGRNRTNEDRMLVGQFLFTGRTVPYFAVFDGHGGRFVSAYLEKYLPEFLDTLFIAPNQANNPMIGDREMFGSCKILFAELGRAMKQNRQAACAGSTANLAFIYDNALWVINAGDSRAILSCDSHVTALSIDADLQSEKDCRSVWKRGYNVFVTDDQGMRRVGPLNMARAVGHDELISGINPRTQIIRYELANLKEGRNYLVIASDGLFDVATSEQVAERVDFLAGNNNSCADIARELVQNALDSDSPDNISVIVVKL